MLFDRADRDGETFGDGAVGQAFVAMQDEHVQAAARLAQQGRFEPAQQLVGRGDFERVGFERRRLRGGVVGHRDHFTAAPPMPVGGDVGGHPEDIGAVVVRKSPVLELGQLDPRVLGAILGHVARAGAHGQEAQHFAVVPDKYIGKRRHVADGGRQIESDSLHIINDNYYCYCYCMFPWEGKGRTARAVRLSIRLRPVRFLPASPAVRATVLPAFPGACRVRRVRP